ncbi:MAG: hypothetical protein IJ190_01235 [Prevotella sp.]|nr:hypothetical protein [Prevotella sp.]
MMAKTVIRSWSETNAETDKIVLLPLHWSTNSFPEIGIHPQKALDRQLVDRSDLLVCIFASKIGTATDTADSGSIEEIEEHVKHNKPVMLYFRKNIDISSTSPENLQKLMDFKQRMKDKTLWWEYNDEHDFKDTFKQHLQEFLNSTWLKENMAEVTEERKTLSQEKVNVSFTSQELTMFYKWANSEDSRYMVVRDRSGVGVIMGPKTGYHFKRGKEEAEWKDFMKRLLDLGYIQIKRVDKENNPIYEITKKGYDFANTLNY